MIDPTQIAKAGTLLCVDRGEYSNYEVTGFFVVLQDFNPRAEVGEFLAEHPNQKEDYHFNEDQFLAVLLAKGLLLEVKYGGLYLGSCVDDIGFTPP
jgi:hypothetical protein